MAIDVLFKVDKLRRRAQSLKIFFREADFLIFSNFQIWRYNGSKKSETP